MDRLNTEHLSFEMFQFEDFYVPPLRDKKHFHKEHFTIYDNQW